MKIAAVLALPYAMNPGMMSVDRALLDLLQGSGRAFELELYSMERALSLNFPGYHMDYRHLTSSEQLAGNDRIIFWGDFLHWKNYVLKDVIPRLMASESGRAQEHILDHWYKLLMLEGNITLQKKSVVFGSSIYGLDARDMIDQRYGAALKALYANAALVKLRDVLSAGFAQQLCQDSASHFGCDCAFFLRSVGMAASSPASPNYIACAFGRSSSNALYGAFARLLSTKARMQISDIAWLQDSGAGKLERKIEMIRNAAFVITDFYHVAVTAMREGTPVLCLARGTMAADSTVADKKKEILMRQHFAGDCLVLQERIHQSFAWDKAAYTMADLCLNVVFDRNYQQEITANLQSHISTVRRELLDQLTAG